MEPEDESISSSLKEASNPKRGLSLERAVRVSREHRVKETARNSRAVAHCAPFPRPAPADAGSPRLPGAVIRHCAPGERSRSRPYATNSPAWEGNEMLLVAECDELRLAERFQGAQQMDACSGSPAPGEWTRLEERPHPPASAPPGIILHGALAADLDMSPARRWFDRHQPVACATAFVLVIHTLRLA